ncbi:hypothetical protein L7F22_061753 [Adiantum nelumboides]|nr:hypothetical protein [Adiantum nelumboides]
MAASAPVLGTTQDAPRPITWTYELTPEDETEMQTAIQHFSGCTLVGRLVGTTPSRPTVREWIESALGGSPARILELSMMTAGLFLLQLSDSVSTDALFARSPISPGSRLVVFQRWTPQFDQDEFDRRQQIPRFPVTLSFSSLPIFMRRCIPRMAARWGIVIPGSFVSETGTPRIQVYAPGDTLFPDLVHIRDRAGQIRAQRMVVTGRPDQCLRCHAFGQIRAQRMVVTGRPDQCLRCHAFGHHARACPRRPQARRQAQAPPPRPMLEARWQQAARRHTFRQRQQQTSIPPAPAPPAHASPAVSEVSATHQSQTGGGSRAKSHHSTTSQPTAAHRSGKAPAFAMDVDFPPLAPHPPPQRQHASDHLTTPPTQKRPADLDDKEDKKGKKPKYMASLVAAMVGDKPNLDASAKANFILLELASKLGIRPKEMVCTAEAGVSCNVRGPSMYTAGLLGLAGGIMYAYQNSAFRLMGHYPNHEDLPKYKQQFKTGYWLVSAVTGSEIAVTGSLFRDSSYWLVSGQDWTGLVSLWFLVQDWLAVQEHIESASIYTGTYYPSTLGSRPSAGTQGSATQDPHIAASDSSSDFDVMEGYPMQQHPESFSQDMHALGQQPGVSMFSRLKKTLSRATRSEHATNEINEGSGEVDLPFTSQIDPVLSESVHVSTPATTPIGLSKLTLSKTLLPDGRSLAEVQEVECYILAAREKEIESLRKAEQRRATLVKAPMTSANPLQSPELTTLKSQPIGSHIASGSKDTFNTSILDGVFLNEN